MLLVRSREAISEPFVSFLIDVNWPRGRLLREYTVLLDPPAMLAPRARARPLRRLQRRPRRPSRAPSPPPAEPAAPSPAQAPAPQAAAPPAYDGSTYQVARGDTLYGIAGSISGGDHPAIQRTMIALFRANPEAFSGNINQLHAGAILRVPPASEIASIASSEAASEVSQQNAAWRAAGGGQESGRLKLVTPPEGEAEAATGPQPSGRVESQINSLEKDIGEQKRLLELRNQELADLQKKLADSRAKEEAAKPQPAPVPEPTPAIPAPPSGETAVAPEDDVGKTTAPVPAKAKPKPPKAKPAPKAEEGPSFVDTLTDNWLILARRRIAARAGPPRLQLLPPPARRGHGRRAEGFRPSAERADTDRNDAPARLAVGDKTAEMVRPPMFEEEEDDEDADIVVEERPIARPKTEAPRPGVGHEETISTEAALDLDQADPLAEADFHMAYGLYDQAVRPGRMALQKEPAAQ